MCGVQTVQASCMDSARHEMHFGFISLSHSTQIAVWFPAESERDTSPTSAQLYRYICPWLQYDSLQMRYSNATPKKVTQSWYRVLLHGCGKGVYRGRREDALVGLWRINNNYIFVSSTITPTFVYIWRNLHIFQWTVLHCVYVASSDIR